MASTDSLGDAVVAYETVLEISGWLPGRCGLPIFVSKFRYFQGSVAKKEKMEPLQNHVVIRLFVCQDPFPQGRG